MEWKKNSIKNLLKNKNMTQTELAEKLGTDRINLNKVINNRRGLDHKNATKMAEILDVQWFQIYEDIDMTVDIDGEIDFENQDLPVSMYDPVEDDKRQIKVFHYVDEPNNLITIFDRKGASVWFMKKTKRQDELTVNGMYFCKFTNGNIGFVFRKDKEYRRYNPTKKWADKKLRQRPAIKYCIPVSRIDFEWEWVNEGED